MKPIEFNASKTEIKICAYVASGYIAKEIASKLFRSVYTITDHIKNIKAKNKFKNAAQMSAAFALTFGDPRRYIAIMLLTIQLGAIYSTNNQIRTFKTAKRVVRIKT